MVSKINPPVTVNPHNSNGPPQSLEDIIKGSSTDMQDTFTGITKDNVITVDSTYTSMGSQNPVQWAQAYLNIFGNSGNSHVDLGGIALEITYLLKFPAQYNLPPGNFSLAALQRWVQNTPSGDPALV